VGTFCDYWLATLAWHRTKGGDSDRACVPVIRTLESFEGETALSRLDEEFAMVTFFCPNCWGEVKETDTVCPHCGVDIAKLLDERDYIAKLIAALSHPEPSTPVRAAWLLGKLRATSAVGALLDLLQGDTDLYVKAAAVEALGEIGETSAEATLAHLAEQGPVLLRRKAEEALRKLRATTTAAIHGRNE
jgi:hypothetical protein